MSLLMNLGGISSANTENVADNYSGLFQEAAEDSLALDRTFDVQLMKLDAYTESVDRELAINIAKSELKCMTEGGTSDDMSYLEDAAEEGALAKFKNMITKLVEAVKEWFSKKKTQVIAKIASKEARDVLSKAEKKVKINPILARKKVQVMNGKRPLGVIHSYRSKNDKILAKTVKGIVTESTLKSITATKESFRDEFRSSLAGAASLTTITIAALLTELNSEIGKLPSYVEKMESCTTDALERLKMTCSEEAAASAIAATNAAGNFGAELAKEEVNVKIDVIMNMMSVLKATVMKAKGLEASPVVKPIKESVEEDPFGYLDGDSFEESAEDLEDLFGISDNDFEESTDDPFGYLDGDSFEESMEDLEDPFGFSDNDFMESADDLEDPFGFSDNDFEESVEEDPFGYLDDSFGESAEDDPFSDLI